MICSGPRKRRCRNWSTLLQHRSYFVFVFVFDNRPAKKSGGLVLACLFLNNLIFAQRSTGLLCAKSAEAEPGS